MGSALVSGAHNTITILYDSGRDQTAAADAVAAGRDITLGDYTLHPQEKEALVRADLEREIEERQRRHKEPKEVLSSEQALARIAEKTKFNVDQLRQNMDQARSESGQFFRVTLIFAGVGCAIIIGGVCLMMAGFGTAGLVSTAASLIPQATALLLFNKDKELRKTIEAYHGQILESQKVLTMIDLAETMSDESKDPIKEQIVFAVLKVTPVRSSASKPTRSKLQKP